MKIYSPIITDMRTSTEQNCYKPIVIVREIVCLKFNLLLLGLMMSWILVSWVICILKCYSLM